MVSCICKKYIVQIQKQHNDFMIAMNLCIGVIWDVHSTHSSKITAELTEIEKQTYPRSYPLQIQKLKLFPCSCDMNLISLCICCTVCTNSSYLVHQLPIKITYRYANAVVGLSTFLSGKNRWHVRWAAHRMPNRYDFFSEFKGVSFYFHFHFHFISTRLSNW